MVSSVSSSAAFSSAMVSSSGSQCRGARDTQAFQEKLFSKLDANGDGGIDQSELGAFVDFASQSVNGTSASSSSTSATDLFKSMDADGDGTLSKSELADGTKKLFEELRTQLMSASAGAASGTSSTDASTSNDATSSATSADAQATDAPPAGAPQGPPPPPGGHHHGGGMFAKIASLLDQYRSNASDSTSTTTEASTLSVAA